MSETENVQAAAVTVAAGELFRAVSNVSAHAETDRTLPRICTVHFKTEDGRLCVEATDRYTAGRERLEISSHEDTGTLDFLADAKDVVRVCKALAAVINPYKFLAEPPQVVVSYQEGTAFASFTITGFPGPDTTLTAVTVEGDFPKLDRLIPDTEGAFTVAFNAKHLARLAKMSGGGKETTVVLRLAGGQKPAVVTLPGNSFTGLVMPVKIDLD